METKHKQFAPYDRVLVRDYNDKWQIDFYSHWNEEYKQHNTLAFGDGLNIEDNDILPYEGNEHLVGITQEPEEEIELKGGEYIFCRDLVPEEDPSPLAWRLMKIYAINEYGFMDKGQATWKFAIRFSDFNPNDMEETLKHILCVKNGKVVRYKE